MKWAVYSNNEDLECIFFKTKEEAELYCMNLISVCVDESMNSEQNLHWDITLMEVKGEVHWGPNGLQLQPK